MSGELHFARTEERQDLRALYAACFPEDEPSFWDWIFSKVYQPENTLVIREGGRVVSSLQMIPCVLGRGGQRLKAHYIYAASTLPQWQGRGLMGELLEQAAQEGERRGQAFSVLITQEDSLLDYYARFGYQSRLMVAFGPPLGQTDASGIRLAGPKDIPAMADLYEQQAGCLLHGLREKDHWERLLDLFGKGAAVWQQGSAVTAYCFFDERGMMEAAGPDAGQLASVVAPGKQWPTLPAGAFAKTPAP